MVGFLLSVIAGLLSVGLFLLWRNTFRSKIEISNVIAFAENFGSPRYLVKVINLFISRSVSQMNQSLRTLY